MARRKPRPAPDPAHDGAAPGSDDATASAPNPVEASGGGAGPVAAQIPPSDPGRPRLGAGTTGGAAPSGSATVEVQFRSSASGLAASLAASAQGFLQGAAAGAATPSMTGRVQEVLLRHNLKSSAPSFRTPLVAADASRLAAAALAGADAPPDPLADQPQLQSFVRLQFDTPENAAAAARELETLPEVERARPVPGAAPPVVSPLPADPLIGSAALGVQRDPATGLEPQWYLHRTSVLNAWNLGARGAGVVIADVDWGYRTTHQDLAPRLEMKNAYNAVDGSQDVGQGPAISHGTAVIAIAGAAADGRGMAGYAPEAALWPIQGDSGPGAPISFDPWADAIEHVRLADSEGRRKVLILEVQTWPAAGNYEQVPSVNAAIRRAIADNVVVCVAAGNGDRPADVGDDGKPIDPTRSILVGATAWDPAVDRRAWFSNWGSRVVVSAPGDPQHDLTCAHTADQAYSNEFGGTSGATPKVAGVAALMLSVNPALTHDDVREILRGTGTEIVPDPAAPEKQIGVFVDAEAAVREALRRAGAEVPGIPAEPTAVRVEGLARQAPATRRRSTEPPPPPPHLQAAPSGSVPDRTLREFRNSTEGLMTREQQLLAIDQAVQLIELFYVHRPLKEAMHAVRPIQRLRVLRRRLEEDPQAWTAKEELRLHNLLTDVFTSVRDLHTNYLLPQPYRDYTAFLPFLVRPYYEPDGRRRYMVTRVVEGFPFSHPDFGKGVEILSWNGVAIEAAVEMNAQQTAGSNLAARHARGMDALTLRPMNVALAPEADRVDITFRRDDGPEQDMRQDWLVRFTPLDDASGSGGSVLTGEPGRRLEAEVGAPPAAAAAGMATAPPAPAGGRRIQEETAFSVDAPGVVFNTMQEVLFSAPAAAAASAPAAAPAAPRPAPATGPAKPDPRRLEYLASLGLDVAADAVREVKQLLFTPATVRAAKEQAGGASAPVAPPEGVNDLPGTMPLVFNARRLIIDGRPVAYVRIRTFAVSDPDAFVQEFIRLVGQLPQEGLLLDVRGNGGGHIHAAERLLQTLTPGPIEPERVQFISTAGTLELCRRNQAPPIDLRAWTGSLEQAVLTGSTYSQALPITDPESCNQIGQCYHGPVVLLIDGRCYSATDIFAAGFQDHGIGQIVGTSPTTGAGGANVWGHDLLHFLYSGEGSPLKPLPLKMGMRIAIRQTLRVGPRAGTLLEDFGVAPQPDRIHRTTRRDLLEEDADLMEFAGRLLAAQPVHRLGLHESARTAERVTYRVDTQGIGRVDFYLNGHPATSVGIAGAAPIEFGARVGTRVELRGFAPEADPAKERWVATLKRTVA